MATHEELLNPFLDPSSAPQFVAPEPEPSPTEREPWYDLYLEDRYNWEGFAADWAAVQLSKGYFAVIDKKDAKRVLRHKWSVNLQTWPDGKIKAIYAMRYAAKRELDKGSPQFIYLHRFITGDVYSGRSVKVDHKNGHGLDNRRCNLHVVNHSDNMANCPNRLRSIHSHLPRGVSPIYTQVRGQEDQKLRGYRGRIKKRGVTRYSKTLSQCPKRAHKWYLGMHKVLNPADDSWNPGGVEPPTFPPDWDGLLSVSTSGDGIPF